MTLPLVLLLSLAPALPIWVLLLAYSVRRRIKGEDIRRTTATPMIRQYSWAIGPGSALEVFERTTSAPAFALPL